MTPESCNRLRAKALYFSLLISIIDVKESIQDLSERTDFVHCSKISPAVYFQKAALPGNDLQG